MTIALRSIAGCSLLTLCAMQIACVSNRHQPDPAELMHSSDCEVVNGDYLIQSVSDGKLLAGALYDQDAVIAELAIAKDPGKIEINAGTDEGDALPTLFFSRMTCADSVLRTTVDDDYSGNGMFMETASEVLEMFASNEDTLSLRLVSTTMGAFFIIPYYNSSDELVTLLRKPEDDD